MADKGLDKDRDEALAALGLEDDDVPDDCDLPPAVIAEFKEVCNMWNVFCPVLTRADTCPVVFWHKYRPSMLLTW